jgi:hypothetical protein
LVDWVGFSMVTTASRTAVRLLWAAVVVMARAGPQAASAESDLKRARTMYNAGQYDEAIAAATPLRNRPELASSATLIIARSRLELFRRAGDSKELATARKELISLNRDSLSAQEAIEWQIGLGAALFLEDQIGPAAEMFRAVIPSARDRLAQPEFEKLLEWWGTTMSRLAESLTGDARKQAYEKFRSDVRLEVERNPFNVRYVLDGRLFARGRRLRWRVERCRRGMDPRRRTARRPPTACRNRSVRGADAHPRARSGANRTASRFEGDHD